MGQEEKMNQGAYRAWEIISGLETNKKQIGEVIDYIVAPLIESYKSENLVWPIPESAIPFGLDPDNSKVFQAWQERILYSHTHPPRLMIFQPRSSKNCFTLEIHPSNGWLFQNLTLDDTPVRFSICKTPNLFKPNTYDYSQPGVQLHEWSEYKLIIDYLNKLAERLDLPQSKSYSQSDFVQMANEANSNSRDWEHLEKIAFNSSQLFSRFQYPWYIPLDGILAPNDAQKYMDAVMSIPSKGIATGFTNTATRTIYHRRYDLNAATPINPQGVILIDSSQQSPETFILHTLLPVIDWQGQTIGYTERFVLYLNGQPVRYEFINPSDTLFYLSHAGEF